MQLIISTSLDYILNLPLSYHHIIQSALYTLMKEEGEDKSEYHDSGGRYGSRVFRAFTFGPLEGHYHVERGRISFDEKVSLEVRSLDSHCIKLIEDNIAKNGIRLGDNVFYEVNVEKKDFRIKESDMIISMRSPICVYETDPDSKHTYFYTPNEAEFYEAVEDNFVRKYAAVYGKYPESGIELQPVQIKDRDKYVTRYKGFMMSGWKGIYHLAGKPEYLDFLYQIGLGAKNSQGFGMFDVVR